jgi:hypothetical protein
MDALEPNDAAIRFALYRRALLLAWVTIVYNLAEGLVSIGFGLRDETLALFGFGVDSFVEVVSGAGILHMVQRIRRRPDGACFFRRFSPC